MRDSLLAAKNAYLVLLLVVAGTVGAQDPDSRVELQALAPEIADSFTERTKEIRTQKAEVEELGKRLESSTGLIAEVLGARLDTLWTAMFDNTAKLARDVLDQRDKGFDVSAYEGDLKRDLQNLPAQAANAMQRLRNGIVFPTNDLPPNEFVVEDQKLRQATQKLDAYYSVLVTNTAIEKRLGLDEFSERETLTEALLESGANRSVFLQLALDDVSILRSAVATLPADAELLDRLAAGEARIKLASQGLQDILDLMDAMGLDDRQYRQQVLTATGELTTDILDVGVFGGLVAQWSAALIEITATEGPRLLFSLLLVIFIVFVALRLAGLVQKLVGRALDASRIRVSNLLRTMIVATARNLIIVIGVLIALSQLGLSLGPLLAGLGIAGFIIGFALQDSLANFASGMLILIYRPFDVGDFVEAGGVTGEVSHMSLVNTTFKTLDNQVLIVPNNLIWSSVITNVTAQTTRRVDLTFGIAYGDDIEKAENLLREIVAEHETVLELPKPNIRVHELGESSVNIIVRPWVKTEDYWDTYWSITRAVKLRFDKEGITIPFPQRDVHVVEEKPA